MKEAVFENDEKTRRVVVGGDKAAYFTRSSSEETYRSPKPFWSVRYVSHDEAIAAAEKWLPKGGVPPVRGFTQ